MLYTFTVTESALDRITDYLDQHYVDRPNQYIMSVQRRLFDDLVFVVIDCDDATAVYLHLIT